VAYGFVNLSEASPSTTKSRGYKKALSRFHLKIISKPTKKLKKIMQLKVRYSVARLYVLRL